MSNEVYVADGYGNRRVIVLDADTFAFKRMWGAYGNKPDDAPLGPYNPDAPPAQQFRLPHNIAISRDGFVYVADRPNNRIQVFRKDGTYVKEAFVSKRTLLQGAASGFALSTDPQQRFLYMIDGANHHVWILERQSLQVDRALRPAGPVGRLAQRAARDRRGRPRQHLRRRELRRAPVPALPLQRPRHAEGRNDPADDGRAPMKALALAFACLAVATTAGAQAPSGETIFQARCASCHNGQPDSRAPSLDALKSRTTQAVIDALVNGAMRAQGSKMNGPDRRAVAEYVTGQRIDEDVTGSSTGRCLTKEALGDIARRPNWTGWSPSTTNARFQPADQAGLRPADLSRLTLKWAFGFPDAASAWAQPTVAGGRVFVGSQNGTVYSLDAATGCIHWTFSAARRRADRDHHRHGRRRARSCTSATQPRTPTRSTLKPARTIWTRKVDDHPLARITGSPTLFEDRLYVAVSSYEESQGADPHYGCCTFRGSLNALDAKTGAVDLEDLHGRRQARAARHEVRPASRSVRPVWLGHLVGADHRREAPTDLRRDRQHLQRTAAAVERCRRRRRSEDRRDSLDAAGDARRRLRHQLRSRGESELPRDQRT